MKKVCIYLRKSRADEELEKSLGNGETLSKHRKALLKFAKENNLDICNIKEEIVSGENLLFRPKMLELLQEVEEGLYNGVLVMDMQRLGRGDMQDQGIILKTFKNSRTKIITPQKTYDLNNDWDEEYSEFEAFMSRKELKMINRRMQGGRVRSVEDGNYIATNPPLGYDIHHINKSRTLKINQSESEIIQLIFQRYTCGDGAGVIATYLNSLGYKTKTNNNFSSSSILTIIRNPVYIGKITWKKKDIRKSLDPNKVKDTRTRDKSEWIISEGKHQPIVELDIFNQAQEILNNRYHIPYQLTNKPVNAFSGVIFCGICGKALTGRTLRGIKRLLCTYKCGNVSSRYDLIENALEEILTNYIDNYKSKQHLSIKENSNITKYQQQINSFEKELNNLKTQKLKLFDLLERGIYTEDVFLSRNENIAQRTETLENEIEKLYSLITTEQSVTTQQNIQSFEKLFKIYKKTKDIENKNMILKKLVARIDYTKIDKTKNFKLTIVPKIVN